MIGAMSIFANEKVADGVVVVLGSWPMIEIDRTQSMHGAIMNFMGGYVIIPHAVADLIEVRQAAPNVYRIVTIPVSPYQRTASAMLEWIGGFVPIPVEVAETILEMTRAIPKSPVVAAEVDAIVRSRK